MSINLDLLNTLKWQIAARVPTGSIFTRNMHSLLHEKYSESDPYHYIYWQDIKGTVFDKYVFGTFGTTNDDYVPFMLWLYENYFDGKELSIPTENGIIRLRYPEMRDYKCFKAEFLDIIMPSITGENPNIPYLEGPYEYDDVRIPNNGVVFDLGANFGLFTSLASSRGAEVYAFEPTDTSYLNYLLPIANENAGITVLNTAISNTVGEADFRMFSNNPSSNKLVPKSKVLDTDITVETTSIDEFVKEVGLDRVDFIKADIEGAERLMLLGAHKTLKRFAPDLSICYYHRFDDKKVLTNLIRAANPDYDIEYHYKKIYARVRKK